MLEVAGRLTDIVLDLDLAIQLALADDPRGVVCDLSAVFEDAEPAAVELLATAGRHVRHWPGIPVAVASPDPLVRAALAAHPVGRHLIATASIFSAVSAALTAPTLVVERKRLTPHPTAPRAARDFVTRTLLDWRLSRVIPFATLVVSELVTSSTVQSGTDLEVSIAWDLGALRLTVRDHSRELPRHRYYALGANGRGVTIVAGLSRAHGVLPTADGKVVWVVLDAPRPTPSIRPRRPRSEAGHAESPVLMDVPGLAGLSISADPS